MMTSFMDEFRFLDKADPDLLIYVDMNIVNKVLRVVHIPSILLSKIPDFKKRLV